MGEKHTGTVAPADERSLVALPESEQLGTDGLATSFTIAASARLSIERVRVGSVELQGTLRRCSQALSVTGWAGSMVAPSPLPMRARWLLFLSHRGCVLTALPRAPPSPLQTACSIACGTRLHCVTQLSAAVVPDRVAACSVGTTTRPNHMQLQHRPATPVELRCHRSHAASDRAR